MLNSKELIQESRMCLYKKGQTTSRNGSSSRLHNTTTHRHHTVGSKKQKKTINLITFKSVINEALSHYLLYVVWNHGACSMTCVQVFLIKSDYSSYYTAAEVQHPFLKSCPILLSYMANILPWPSMPLLLLLLLVDEHRRRRNWL